MDTVRKGDKLEDLIFDFFSTEITQERFFAKRDLCKVFKKKGYYSRDRQKEIIFDISIEVYLPGSNAFSLLVLIECKNYSHPVPVDDVEEFFQKTQQVSGANIKGIVVSTNTFQEGAFKFSRSKGLGLARYFQKDSLTWVLNRSPSSLSYSDRQNNHLYAYKGLRDCRFKRSFFDFLGTVNELYTTSLNDFFDCLFDRPEKCPDDVLSKIKTERGKPAALVEYLSEENIESISQEALELAGNSHAEVDLDRICEYLIDKFELEISLNTPLEDGILGTIQFAPLAIKIDSKKIIYEGRIRFTLAHELGHYFLGHSRYISSESCFDSVIDLDSNEEISLSDISKMEWQANRFASSLLLPKARITREFLDLANSNNLFNRGYGYLYLDDQSCNLDAYYKITSELRRRFKVSREVITYRLEGLGLLNDQRRVRSVLKHLKQLD